MQIYDLFKEQKRLLAWLIDPDKFNDHSLSVVEKNRELIDLILLGSSMQFSTSVPSLIQLLKSELAKPIVLFPGSYFQVYAEADAILFLSLISGRNPEYLISQQVVAAPTIASTQLEVISCGYILIDGGRISSTAYLTQTIPIPADKKDLIVATALAGKFLGHRVLYLEAGSGATYPVPPSVISEVARVTQLPIIVGGGIRSPEAVQQAFDAGATCVVVGNIMEENPHFFDNIKK